MRSTLFPGAANISAQNSGSATVNIATRLRGISSLNERTFFGCAPGDPPPAIRCRSSRAAAAAGTGSRSIQLPSGLIVMLGPSAAPGAQPRTKSPEYRTQTSSGSSRKIHHTRNIPIRRPPARSRKRYWGRSGNSRIGETSPHVLKNAASAGTPGPAPARPIAAASLGSFQRQRTARAVARSAFHLGVQLHLIALDGALMGDLHRVAAEFDLQHERYLVAVHFAVADLDRLSLRHIHRARQLGAILLERERNGHSAPAGAADIPRPRSSRIRRQGHPYRQRQQHGA